MRFSPVVLEYQLLQCPAQCILKKKLAPSPNEILHFPQVLTSYMENTTGFHFSKFFQIYTFQVKFI